MSFVRSIARSAGLAKDSRPGDGWEAYCTPVIQATDSNQVIAASAISGGLYVRSGMTAGRSDTTDTAAAILAANPDMDNGDTLMLAISVTTAFALTLIGGTGVTAVGAKTIAASGFAFVMFTKTSSTTMTYQVL